MSPTRALLFAIALVAFASFPAFSRAQTGEPAPPPLILLTTLTKGSSGTDVSHLQEFLRDHGYFTFPTLTGFFGPVTEAAIVSFQQDNAIDPIGIAGPLTRARILVISSDLPKPPVSEAVATTTPKKRSSHHHHSRSSVPPAPVETDTEAPLVSLTTGDLGDSLFGAAEELTVHATATDNVGVVSAQFFMDDAAVGAAQTGASPYSTNFTTADYAEGRHDLSAVVHDAALNYATSTASIYIDKTAPSISFVNPPSQLQQGTVLRVRVEVSSLDPEFDTEENLIVSLTMYATASPGTVLFYQSGTVAESPLVNIDTSLLELGSYVVEGRVTDITDNTSLVTQTITLLASEEYN